MARHPLLIPGGEQLGDAMHAAFPQAAARLTPEVEARHRGVPVAGRP